MRSDRRWFQYSLRSFLVLLTALAVWLGVVVNRAREQREAVEAIHAGGGAVAYDWEIEYIDNWKVGQPAGTGPHPAAPAWMRRLCGDDLFQKVYFVSVVSESEFLKAVPQLRRLPHLKHVTIYSFEPEEAESRITGVLPGMFISVFMPPHDKP